MWTPKNTKFHFISTYREQFDDYDLLPVQIDGTDKNWDNDNVAAFSQYECLFLPALTVNAQIINPSLFPIIIDNGELSFSNAGENVESCSAWNRCKWKLVFTGDNFGSEKLSEQLTHLDEISIKGLFTPVIVKPRSEAEVEFVFTPNNDSIFALKQGANCRKVDEHNDPFRSLQPVLSAGSYEGSIELHTTASTRKSIHSGFRVNVNGANMDEKGELLHALTFPYSAIKQSTDQKVPSGR